MRMARIIPALVVAGFAVSLAPAVLAAQGVTVTSNSSMKGAGVIGMALRMGGGGDVTSTTFISGHKLRTDNKDNSTIIDVDAGRFITIDHRRKAYTVMTFEQLAQAMSAAADSMKAAKARGETKAKNAKPEEQKYEMDYSVKVDPTGERQKIAGYDASRTFITITMGAHEKGQEARADEGKLAIVVDEWLSTTAPNAAAMREFQRAYAAKMGREFEQPMKQMAAAFNANPQMKEGMAAAAKEMAKQQGVPLKNDLYFVIVPEGKTLDRQLAVSGGEKAQAEAKAEQKQEKPKGGLFGKLKAVAQAAEQQEQGDQKGAPKDAQQSTIFSTLTEVQAIKTGVPSDAFSIPAGYKEMGADMSRMR